MSPNKFRLSCFHFPSIILLFGAGVLTYLFYSCSYFNTTDPSYCSNRISNALDPNYVESNLLSLDQTEPQLIQYVRVKYLTPPSKREYNMKTMLKKKKEPTDLYEKMIARFFKNKRNGTFIEAGAHDGDGNTHTYFLERELGWKGLLVECSPIELPKLLRKNRKAWISNACISPNNHFDFLNFSTPTDYTIAGTLRKVESLPERFQLKDMNMKWASFDVPAVPFYTLIAALGWTEIDYLSLDIEGHEVSALKHFPLDKVIFKVLIVEIQILTKEEQQELNDVLSANGYTPYKDVRIDRVFIHNSVKHLLQEDFFP